MSKILSFGDFFNEAFLNNSGDLEDFNFENNDSIQYSKVDALNDYAKLLKQNGFSIIFPKEPYTWIFFTKDNKIGKVEYVKYDGFKFSSVHKPTTGFGTGYGIDFGDDNIYEPTIDMATVAMNTVKPAWDRRTKGLPVKYKDAIEFVNSSTNNLFKYLID